MKILKTDRTAWSILTILMLILFESCREDDPQPPFDLNTFEGVVASGGSFEPVEESQEIESLEVNADSTINGAEWSCKRERHTVISSGADFPLFNTSASVIYPGSLLVGSSLENATPDPIAVDRAGGTISYNLINGNTQPFFEVDEISKGKVQGAMNNIIQNSPGAIPSNFVFEFSEVQSEQQLSLALGINVKNFSTQVGSKMNFSSDKSYSRYLVKLTQAYYTMSFDLPGNYADLFAPQVTPRELTKLIGPGNPGTYISDVTYGRIYYMLIESTETSTKMSASINASFNGFVNKVSGEVDAAHLENLSNLKIKVIAFGGDAQGTIAMSGETDLSVIAERLAATTDIKLGLPLSYVVRSIYDNKIVNVKLATEYDVITCEPSGPGTLNFLNKQTLNTSLNLPYSSQQGDITGDGLTDLILNHKQGNVNQIQIAVAQGDGTFALTQAVTHPSIPTEKWTAFELKIGDFNGDKKIDLIWNLRDIYNKTYLALSNGDGSFSFGEEFAFPNTGWSAYIFHVGDFNGDTYDDVAWNELSNGPNKMYVAFSNGATMDIANASYELISPSGWSSYQARLADTNGDDRCDFVWERHLNDNGINIGVSNGDGTFTRTGYEIGSGWNNYVLNTGDIDKDGYDDLVFDNRLSGVLNVFRCKSDGSMINARITSGFSKASDEFYRSYLADINADGAMDFVWNDLSEDGNVVGVGLSTGDGMFNFNVATQYHPNNEELWQQFNNRLMIGKLNGDHKDDLIWVEEAASMKVYVALAK